MKTNTDDIIATRVTTANQRPTIALDNPQVLRRTGDKREVKVHDFLFRYINIHTYIHV